MEFQSYFAFVFIGLFGLHLLVPGPNLLYLLGSFGRGGQRGALAFACGTALGTTCWATAAVVGGAQLFQLESNAAKCALIALGLALIAFGLRHIRDAIRRPAPTDAEASCTRSFLCGITVTLANVNEVVFWSAVTAILASHQVTGAEGAGIVLGTGLIAFLFDAGVVFAVSGNWLGRRVLLFRRPLELGMGVAFSGSGFWLVGIQITALV